MVAARYRYCLTAAEGSPAVLRPDCCAYAERDELASALRNLANPNWSARPTGDDARRMAAYARSELERITGES